jgi:hypothetical protein
MIARDADDEAMIAGIGCIKAFAKELFPAILAIGGGGISVLLREAWVVGVPLNVLRVDACRG